MTKTSAGRPEVPAAAKLRRVGVCMTAAEIAGARRAAKAAGLSLSAWARKRVSEALSVRA